MPPETKLSIQSWLCPALTPVPANLDYARFKETIENIDKVILTTCVESLAANYAVANEKDLNEKQQTKKAEFGIYALRANLLSWTLDRSIPQNLTNLLWVVIKSPASLISSRKVRFPVIIL